MRDCNYYWTNIFTSRIVVGLLITTWLCATVAGMSVLWDHEARPGVTANAPQDWPVASRLARKSLQSTILVWIHPHCPCSWATVRELERLLVHLPADVDCQVVLTRPPNCGDEFVETDLTRAVRKLPRVKIFVDTDQLEAERFGVLTSGQVLIYDRNDQLTFAGGITIGRGHEGDSIGASKVRNIFQTECSGDTCQGASVFGCELFGAADNQDKSL